MIAQLKVTAYEDSGLVFAMCKGTPLDAQNIVNRYFKPLLQCAERWLQYDLILHVHLRTRSRFGESQAQDLCLVFVKERVGGFSALQEMCGGVPPDGITHRPYRRINHLSVKGTVLVNRSLGRA